MHLNMKSTAEPKVFQVDDALQMMHSNGSAITLHQISATHAKPDHRHLFVPLSGGLRWK